MDVLNATDENDTDTEDWSCGGSFKKWVTVYANVYHPYFSILVCILGIVTNCLNIIVLTRKDMATAPINRILTALAWADMLLMMEYIPFSYYYSVESQRKQFPYYGAVYMLFHIHVSQYLHTSSVNLTLTLAVWRFLAIRYIEKNHVLCSHRRCTIAIIISYVLPIVLYLPNYPTFAIKTTNVTEDKVYILYHVQLSDWVVQSGYLLKINFWLYSIQLKLLPCLLLIVISIWLIRTLFKAKKGRQVLKGYDNLLIANGRESKKVSKYERRADRTTKMLIAILVLFLLTELPQGLLALVIGLRGKELFLTCYQHYGEVMDILALLNGSINFILYCFMNRMFRITFGQLFKNRILGKWVQPTISETPTVILGSHKTVTTTV